MRKVKPSEAVKVGSYILIDYSNKGMYRLITSGLCGAMENGNAMTYSLPDMERILYHGYHAFSEKAGMLVYVESMVGGNFQNIYLLEDSTEIIKAFSLSFIKGLNIVDAMRSRL